MNRTRAESISHRDAMNKQHILDEIRRTAAANGGKPLGHREFFKITGIRENDWSGRHWARWGDAVRDAGYAPNAMSVAYTEETLLSKLAKLTRELGKFPVSSEVALARRRDVTFPTEKTYRRFGGKATLVTKLLEYCEAHADLEDVALICRAINPASGRSIDEDSDDEDIEIGFVYLMKSGRHYKVGRSNAAGRREREIALQMPEKVNTVHVIRTDDPPGIEAYWHQRFSDKRLNGEWFGLTAADVRTFKRRKFM